MSVYNTHTQNNFCSGQFHDGDGTNELPRAFVRDRRFEGRDSSPTLTVVAHELFGIPGLPAVGRPMRGMGFEPEARPRRARSAVIRIQRLQLWLTNWSAPLLTARFARRSSLRRPPDGRTPYARDGIRTHGPRRERVLSPPPLAKLSHPRAFRGESACRMAFSVRVRRCSPAGRRRCRRALSRKAWSDGSGSRSVSSVSRRRGASLGCPRGRTGGRTPRQ